jgi:Arc/MetJ family transcription regulator
LYIDLVQNRIYYEAMIFHKTTVEIDTEALSAAERALGTRSIKDTVNGALREVARREALDQAALYVGSGKLHLPDEATLASWREPRG